MYLYLETCLSRSEQAEVRIILPLANKQISHGFARITRM
jgi:hypothetical protein